MLPLGSSRDLKGVPHFGFKRGRKPPITQSHYPMSKRVQAAPMTDDASDSEDFTRAPRINWSDSESDMESHVSGTQPELQPTEEETFSPMETPRVEEDDDTDTEEHDQNNPIHLAEAERQAEQVTDTPEVIIVPDDAGSASQETAQNQQEGQEETPATATPITDFSQEESQPDGVNDFTCSDRRFVDDDSTGCCSETEVERPSKRSRTTELSGESTAPSRRIRPQVTRQGATLSENVSSTAAALRDTPVIPRRTTQTVMGKHITLSEYRRLSNQQSLFDL